MKVRTMIGIAVAFLFAWGPAAKADDLEDLVATTAEQKILPHDKEHPIDLDANHVPTDEEVGRISETKEALRLYLALDRLQNTPIALTKDLSKPTVVPHGLLSSPFDIRSGAASLVISPQGPFKIEDARGARNQAEADLNRDKVGPDGGSGSGDQYVIIQRKANLDRWNEIVAYMENKLDGEVHGLADNQSFSESFSQHDIDSFSKLESAVGNAKELKAFDAATLKTFVEKANKPPEKKPEEKPCPNGEIGLLGKCGPGGHPKK